MISLETLTTFFGWCIVIDICAILIMLLVLTVFKGGIARMMSKMFGVGEEDVRVSFFKLFHQLRVAVFVFHAVPWIALLLMG